MFLYKFLIIVEKSTKVYERIFNFVFIVQLTVVSLQVTKKIKVLVYEKYFFVYTCFWGKFYDLICILEFFS